MTIKLKLCLIFIGTVLNVFSQSAQAHLMAPYKGTLNFDHSGGYLVLSLPASTLMGFDKDKDRILTLGEIKSQQKTIIEYITDKPGINPLMGWESSTDTLTELKLEFSTKALAIKYAKKNKINFEIIESKVRKIIKKSYSDNFIN